MAEYLTEAAIFGCSACPSTVIRARDSESKVRLNGSRVLTKKASIRAVTMGIPCPFLTAKANGVPTPCAFPGLKGSDLTGSDDNCGSANSAFLTKKARGFCSHAGTAVISVTVASIRPGFFKQFGGNSYPDQSGDSDSGSAAKAAGGKAQNLSLALDAPSKPQASPVAGQNAPLTAAAASGEKPVVNCDTCKEAADCEFLAEKRAKVLVRENDAASKLRKNYVARMNGEKEDAPVESSILNSSHLAHRAYENAREVEARFRNSHPDNPATWNYPAHHLICVDQIISTPGLNDLARFYDYDMNCADNCILLLGLQQKGEKFGGKERDKKHSFAFECMAWGRMQWHAGGHQYPLDKVQAAVARQMVLRKYASKADVYEERPNYAELGIKCYLEHLKEKIAQIVQKYQRYQGCPKKNFEAKKKQFHAAMNKLAEEIRTRLARFYEKPHRSFPWFVSREAWIYAFMLPHCTHIVSILPRDQGLLLERFNLTRYEDTLKKMEDASKVELFSIAKLANSNGPEKMLWRVTDDPVMAKRFCADSAFFILGEGLANDCAGFAIPEKYIFRLGRTDAESAFAELKKRQSELLGRIQVVLEDTGNTLKPLQLITGHP